MNLMHINATPLQTMERGNEYQQLFINNLIGELADTSIMRMRKTKVLAIQLNNMANVTNHLLEVYENAFSTSPYNMYIVDKNFIAIIDWQFESKYTGLLLSVVSRGVDECQGYIQEIENHLKEYLFKSENLISYTILQNDHASGLSELYYQDSIDIDFNQDAIPFIYDVESYIESFLNSKAPVLILQGEPGTGKTTFIKKILQTMLERLPATRENFSALYSFDETIFYLSEFYRRIIYDHYDVLVLEDINQVLHKNLDDEGINPINKFLSVTDGLISKYKKIIISTNIESRSQLNPALLRPGRCYDVVAFRKLESVEIDNLCDSLGWELDAHIESINISEFYARMNQEKNTSLTLSKVGF